MKDRETQEFLSFLNCHKYIGSFAPPPPTPGSQRRRDGVDTGWEEGGLSGAEKSRQKQKRGASLQTLEARVNVSRRQKPSSRRLVQS